MTVLTGLARLVAEGGKLIAGRRVGLLCNATSVDAELRHAIDLIRTLPNVNLTVLFGLELGVRGDAREMIGVAAATDAAAGLPVPSLYGPTEASLSPTPAMLENIDVLV